MLIVPAIDLLGGNCVRLYKGNYRQSTVYSDDPVETARRFEAAGAKVIHVVDLDAARGQGNNRSQIRRICRAVRATVEVGGGIRSETDVAQLQDIGVKRLIVGTVLAQKPESAAAWIASHPSVDFIAGIDALNGRVQVSGWEADSGMTYTQLALLAKQVGCAAIIYTNIAKDGTLQGPDIANSRRVAQAAALPLTVSGGISSLADIRRAAEAKDPPFWGVITGKALYEGRFSLSEAVSAFQNET